MLADVAHGLPESRDAWPHGVDVLISKVPGVTDMQEFQRIRSVIHGSQLQQGGGS